MQQDYDELFTSIGICKQEEREVVMDFLKHLGSIYINSKKHKIEEHD